jgi:uncharacterized protein YjbI with pentapeptide repeats
VSGDTDVRWSSWLLAGTGLLVAVGIGVGLGWAFHPSGPTAVAPGHTSAATNAPGTLANQKVRADIQLDQAQAEQALQDAASTRDGDVWWREAITPVGTVVAAGITGFVAYLAVVLPLRRQRQQDRVQRQDAADKDIQQRKDALNKEVEQSRKDRIQRFDAGFAAAVSSLGSENASIQAGGAAALQSYLRPDLDEFFDQVYAVLRANLDQTIDHPDPVRRLLVAALAKALLRSPPSSGARVVQRTHSLGRGNGPDLSRAWMRNADFRGLDLSDADIAFSDLSNARLDGGSLRRSWGREVNLERAALRGVDLEEARFQGVVAPKANFDGARLISARFEGASLSGARFRAAKLQSAHFQGASLEQADFRDAHVSDTFFQKANFDDDSLGTLLLTHTWRALSSREAPQKERDDAETLARKSLDSQSADRLMALSRRR